MAENDPEPASKGWKIAEGLGRLGVIVSLVTIAFGAALQYRDDNAEAYVIGNEFVGFGVLGLLVFGPLYAICRLRVWWRGL